MPRGRGRKGHSSQRGTSSSSRRSTSSSSARQTTPKRAPQLSNRPLRRSVRISALAARKEESLSEGHLQGGAETLQYQPLTTQSPPDEMKTSSPRGSMYANASSRFQGPSQKSAYERGSSLSPVEEGARHTEQYKMNMISQPPPEVRIGTTIEPFPIISLGPRSPRSAPASDMSGVWALASLTTADGSEVLTPPRPDILVGVLVDSIHLVADSAHGPETGYALFPNLRIQQPGDYRIRISLIDMDSNGSSLGMSSQGGMNIQVVNSSVFTVHDAAPLFQPNLEERQLLRRLRNQGITVPEY